MIIEGKIYELEYDAQDAYIVSNLSVVYCLELAEETCQLSSDIQIHSLPI